MKKVIVSTIDEEFEKAAGTRRKGRPRTEEERRARHKRLYGTTELPPRGTGLRFEKGHLPKRSYARMKADADRKAALEI